MASYIFQGRRISRPRAALQGLLDRCAAPALARGLLDAMVAGEELVEDARGLRLGATWLDRSGGGELHTTIEEPPGAVVRDEQTGRTLAFGVIFGGGRGLRVGGHLLEVRRWDDFKVEVRRVADEALARGEWRYSARPWLRGAGQPQAVRRYLGLAEDEWPVVAAGDGATAYVFHFGGARRRAALELLAARGRDAPAPRAITDWMLALPAGLRAKPGWLAPSSPATLDSAVAGRLAELERTLGRPAANRRLPLEARLDEVRGWLRLDDELARCRAACWTRPRDPAVEAVLRALGAGSLAAEEAAEEDDASPEAL